MPASGAAGILLPPDRPQKQPIENIGGNWPKAKRGAPSGFIYWPSTPAATCNCMPAASVCGLARMPRAIAGLMDVMMLASSCSPAVAGRESSLPTS